MTKKCLFWSDLKVEFKKRMVAKFQEQNCNLTLKEALEEFYLVNTHLFKKPKPETSWSELLVHHDVSHVFFGVNTSLEEETAGDLWSFFATDLTFKDYKEYFKAPEAKQLFKEIGVWNTFRALLMLPLLSFRVLLQSFRMKKKWKFRGYKKYLDTPLCEIRKEYHLNIL